MSRKKSNEAHLWVPHVYDYMDYRAYLKEYYTRAKHHTRHMSFRYLSRRAGFRSPNYIKLVMDGDRNLSADGSVKIADALDLNREDRAFFLNLVAFNQSDDHDERNALFAKLSSHKQFRKARRIDQAMFEYLSHWYYPAIREMIARHDFVDDPAWIARQLHPNITTQQAARALDLLLDLGLISREESTGRYARQEPHLTTGHEVTSLAVGNYHRQMTSLAMEAMQSVRAVERYMSAMTMCVDEQHFDALRQKILEFREEMLAVCEQSDEPDRVYQFNLQFFPLTR